MSKFVAVVLLLTAIIAPTALLATQAQQGTGEVRISAFKHEDGRIEFGLQSKEGGTWSERTLPRVRFLPSNAQSGRWYNSSEFTIGTASSTSMTVEAEESPVVEFGEGHLGSLYEWTYDDIDEGEITLTRHRVEWSALQGADAIPYIRVTLPDEDDSICARDDAPCRYSLTFLCHPDVGLIARLSYTWFLNKRVTTWSSDEDLQQIGWEHRRPTIPNRITTSVDHSAFSDSWQVYEPRGQDPTNPRYTYGGDFVLEGDAAHAFMQQLLHEDALSVTVWHRFQDDETFTFDIEGAFDNPAAGHLARCGLPE